MFNKKYIRATTTEDIKRENLKKQHKVVNSILYRYPRAFVTVVSISSILIFFSKPLYDIFFSDPFEASLVSDKNRYPRNFKAKWLYEAKAAKEEEKLQRLEKLQQFEMEAVKRARNRYLQFPKLLMECKAEAAMYASCIDRSKDNLLRGTCQEDFEKFRSCLTKAASKLGTRI